MKNILISLPVLLLLIGLGSCEQQFPVESPEIIKFEYDPETAYPGANTYFEVEVIGDYSVIWSGAEDSNYDTHLANPSVENTGFFFNPLLDKLTQTKKIRKGIKYNQTGTYTAVLVVSNVGYQGEIIETITQEMSVTIVPFSLTEITAFAVGKSIGDAVISGDTVSVLMPFGFDLTSIKPKISVSDSATVSPASGVEMDFTNTVIYTVTAQDGVTTKDWKVIITTEEPLTGNDITAFSIPEEVGAAVINDGDHTIALDVYSGTDVAALVPDFTISEEATVSPASGAAADFSSPVVYTVTAQDGTSQDWTVTVTVMPARSDTDITSFSIPEQVGDAIINSTYHTVSVAVPSGTAVTVLTPTIEVSGGAVVSPESDTATDFTNTVTYTVTAEDGSTTQDWTVTVTVLD